MPAENARVRDLVRYKIGDDAGELDSWRKGGIRITTAIYTGNSDNRCAMDRLSVGGLTQSRQAAKAKRRRE